jgi:hypothetical protein
MRQVSAGARRYRLVLSVSMRPLRHVLWIGGPRQAGRAPGETSNAIATPVGVKPACRRYFLRAEFEP